MTDGIENGDLPQAVTDAKAKGDVFRLTGENGDAYYFRKPGKPEMNRYLGTAAKGKVATAVNNLVMDLAVSPDADALRAKFSEKPGLMVALNNALQNAVGINEDFEVKKL